MRKGRRSENGEVMIEKGMEKEKEEDTNPRVIIERWNEHVRNPKRKFPR